MEGCYRYPLRNDPNPGQPGQFRDTLGCPVTTRNGPCHRKPLCAIPDQLEPTEVDRSFPGFARASTEQPESARDSREELRSAQASECPSYVARTDPSQPDPADASLFHLTSAWVGSRHPCGTVRHGPARDIASRPMPSRTIARQPR
jgi:hypothetical protein